MSEINASYVRFVIGDMPDSFVPVVVSLNGVEFTVTDVIAEDGKLRLEAE